MTVEYSALNGTSLLPGPGLRVCLGRQSEVKPEAEEKNCEMSSGHDKVILLTCAKPDHLTLLSGAHTVEGEN